MTFCRSLDSAWWREFPFHLSLTWASILTDCDPRHGRHLVLRGKIVDGGKEKTQNNTHTFSRGCWWGYRQGLVRVSTWRRGLICLCIVQAPRRERLGSARIIYLFMLNLFSSCPVILHIHTWHKPFLYPRLSSKISLPFVSGNRVQQTIFLIVMRGTSCSFYINIMESFAFLWHLGISSIYSFFSILINRLEVSEL